MDTTIFAHALPETITYQYRRNSTFRREEEKSLLFLEKYSEIERKNAAPCFFAGALKEPFMTSRCLITLSQTVKAVFYLTPSELARLLDPIVTAGNGKLRFEGFSHEAGVYGRVDVLPDGLRGEFIENGTTNVDFNEPMVNALSGVRKGEDVRMSVGNREVALQTADSKVVEKKVPLPSKWIKGLASVQIFLSLSEERHTFNKVQAMKLFQGIPKTRVTSDYYLILRGGLPTFTPMKSQSAVLVGGLHRLRLLEPLLPYADKLTVFAHPDMQSTTWQLYFGNVRYSLSLSRESSRGFSGEGAALESLLESLPEDWIERMDKYSYANQEFNPAFFAREEQIDLARVEQLTARLAAMGLLGYDLDEKGFFYRRLPFKPERIMGLNPRIKGAEKLIADNKVKIVNLADGYVKARVEGSGVNHTVIIEGEKARCTCAWYSRHQGERGACKHVLAARKMTKEATNREKPGEKSVN